jgi:septal ring factor EnvC (AmiA/AmiB activator)
MQHRRNQWQAKATQRSDHHGSLRQQLARVKAERDQAKQALKATQSRLRQLESHTQAMAVRPNTTARVHSRWRDCANRRLR